MHQEFPDPGGSQIRICVEIDLQWISINTRIAQFILSTVRCNFGVVRQYHELSAASYRTFCIPPVNSKLRSITVSKAALGRVASQQCRKARCAAKMSNAQVRYASQQCRKARCAAKFTEPISKAKRWHYYYY